jgi:hypothetical protein
MSSPATPERLDELSDKVLGLPIVGYRAWNLTATYLLRPLVGQRGTRLSLFDSRPPWLPNEDQAATCDRHHSDDAGVSATEEEREDSKAPNARCVCGFNAMKKWAPSPGGYSGSVVGSINQWGKTVMGEVGQRSEFASVYSISHLNCFGNHVINKYESVSFMPEQRDRTNRGKLLPQDPNQALVVRDIMCKPCSDNRYGLNPSKWMPAMSLMEEVAMTYGVNVDQELPCDHSANIRRNQGMPLFLGGWRCGSCESDLDVKIKVRKAR